MIDPTREGASPLSSDIAPFAPALVAGTAVAFACGVGYAILAWLTHLLLSLATIGIGWAVGSTIRRVTRGHGRRRHQVLAVALTYCASSMGYLPSVASGLADEVQRANQVAPAASTLPAASTPSAAPASGAPEQTSPPSGTEPSEPSGLGLIIGLAASAVVIGVLTLAGPLLDLANGFGALVGLVIMLFGLRAAWRTSQPPLREPGGTGT
jgi:hypothetical protein